MDVRDKYFKRTTYSRPQQYNSADNGIVVDGLMVIFKQML